MPDQLTPDELAAMKRRCEAATKGPWVVDFDSRPHGAHQVMSGHRTICFLGIHPEDDSYAIDNADFIAAARTDLPRLIAEVERLRDLLDSCRNDRDFEVLPEEARANYEATIKERDQESARLRAEVERLRKEWDEAVADNAAMIQYMLSRSGASTSQTSKFLDNIHPGSALLKEVERLRKENAILREREVDRIIAESIAAALAAKEAEHA